MVGDQELIFNVSKCGVLSIGSKRQVPLLQGNNEIAFFDHSNDLGIGLLANKTGTSMPDLSYKSVEGFLITFGTVHRELFRFKEIHFSTVMCDISFVFWLSCVVLRKYDSPKL